MKEKDLEASIEFTSAKWLGLTSISADTEVVSFSDNSRVHFDFASGDVFLQKPEGDRLIGVVIKGRLFWNFRGTIALLDGYEIRKKAGLISSKYELEHQGKSIPIGKDVFDGSRLTADGFELYRVASDRIGIKCRDSRFENVIRILAPLFLFEIYESENSSTA